MASQAELTQDSLKGEKLAEPMDLVKDDMDVFQDEGHTKENLESGMRNVELGGQAEKRLLRKLDIHIIPIIMLLYLCSFLDRVNIGNARLYSLEKDLNLHGQQYQVSVSLVFVTYVLFEVPSNMVLKKFTPRIWIPFITIIWGVVATLMGLVNTYGELLACRLIMGAFEAGLFPGMTVYLTFFYSKHELGLRVGYLLVCAALAGACGGLLAFGIGAMDGIRGLHGWRWIFIIEGIPTVCLGIATYFLMANDSQSAYFLSEEEKALMIARRRNEYGQTASAQHFNRTDALKAFRDWKVWGMATGQFAINVMLYGYSTFLPTIINGLSKWTPAQVQLLTIPCYATGAILYMIIARLSDRYQRRAFFVIVFCFISIIGYALLISNVSAGVRYFGCFLVAAGLYITLGLPLAWLPNNIPRYGKRTAASAIQMSVAATSGIMAPFIYPTAEGPRYIKGHSITLAMVAYAALCYGSFWLYFNWRNARRERGEEDWRIEGKTDAEVEEMGDESPRFRFTV